MMDIESCKWAVEDREFDSYEAAATYATAWSMYYGEVPEIVKICDFKFVDTYMH